MLCSNVYLIQRLSYYTRVDFAGKTRTLSRIHLIELKYSTSFTSNRCVRNEPQTELFYRTNALEREWKRRRNPGATICMCILVHLYGSAKLTLKRRSNFFLCSRILKWNSILFQRFCPALVFDTVLIPNWLYARKKVPTLFFIHSYCIYSMHVCVCVCMCHKHKLQIQHFYSMPFYHVLHHTNSEEF